jgi:hypothetical protein
MEESLPTLHQNGTGPADRQEFEGSRSVAAGFSLRRFRLVIASNSEAIGRSCCEGATRACTPKCLPVREAGVPVRRRGNLNNSLSPGRRGFLHYLSLPWWERARVRPSALCPLRYFRKSLTLRLHLRPVLGDYARDALSEGLTSSYEFNTLLVVFRTLYRATGCLH